jgi:hypothetical protein
MKNVLFAIISLLSVSAFAQTFEGTIQWTIKSEITDPALKKQMEESKARMNDPANKAKMKEMEDRMNDPQMKKLMEANPQMKAQMEQMMKMQQGGGPTNLFPTSMTIKMKNGNTLTVTEGGMMPSEVLYQKGKDASFMINRQNKTFSPMPVGPPSNTPAVSKQPEVKVTKTSETAKILNYTCTKYIAEITQDGKSMTQIFWTTTEIKDLDKKMFSQQKLERGRPMMYENMEGIPLRMEINYPEMKGKMMMEVTEIKKEGLNDEVFTIPADFKNIPPAPGMAR